jgi:hypothetical protein
MEKELAIEHDVVAGEEAHDPGVDFHSRFLPQQIAHRTSPFRLLALFLTSFPRRRESILAVHQDQDGFPLSRE